MEKRLGKGLDALISQDISKPKEKVEKISLKDIVPNPFQPRKKFVEEKMAELVSSLREKGVIQPILVRTKGEGYEYPDERERHQSVQDADQGFVLTLVPCGLAS